MKSERLISCTWYTVTPNSSLDAGANAKLYWVFLLSGPGCELAAPSSSSSSSSSPWTSATRSPAFSRVRLVQARTHFQTAYRNVTTPMMTKDQEIFSKRSRPVPPCLRPPPPPKPVCRILSHYCQVSMESLVSQCD